MNSFETYGSGELQGTFDNRETMTRERWQFGRLVRTLTSLGCETDLVPFGAFPDPKAVSNLWINPS